MRLAESIMGDSMNHRACGGSNSCMMTHAFTPPRDRRRVPAGRVDIRLMPASETQRVETPEDLLHRVAVSQDRAAFQSLFTHFAPRIKAYLLRGGAPAQQAEDLAQEAMLTVWRKAALFDPAKASAATWVFTIARNLRIDMIRRARHPGFDPADPALLPQELLAPDAILQSLQDTASLRRVLETLPPDQAEVVSLFFFADEPHSRIAEQLGIPLGTVKSRIRLALARLRAGLGDRS